jgi:uncharacterized protein
MFLELEQVFNTPGLSVPFDYTLEGFEGMLPLARQPRVAGAIKNRAGVVTLEGSAQISLSTQCDRCAAPFEYRSQAPLEHTLVLSLNREEESDHILLEGTRYAPDDLVWEDIVLAVPSRLLCKPDCEGLCLRCGSNLNEAPCDCKPDTDPRWAILQDLL